MKPNSYSLSSTPKVTSSHYSQPSVPMSVYRQVVDELQATKAQLAAIKTNNRQMQQEVAQLIQSAYRAQQIVSRVNHQLTHRSAATKVKPIWQAKSWDLSPRQQVATIKYPSPSYSRRKHNSQAINGWFLAVAIVIIILTAFTSGFVLVRPLLSSND